MHLYFVRHAESEANVANQFSHKNDNIAPLTIKGTEQAHALDEILRPIKFAAIYSSPMLRARQTAEIINEPHGLQIQVTPAVREHDAGDLEGRNDPASWRAYQDLFESWIIKRDLDAFIPDGESFNQLSARFGPFLAGVIARYANTDANILIVGHAGIFHAMLPNSLSNVDYAFGVSHILGNTAVVHAEHRDDVLRCIEWDGHKFTEEDVT